MSRDPKIIIREAVVRGATHMELLRAAAACARAVVSLVPDDNPDALAAIEAAERWAMDPSRGMPYVAALAEQACQKLRKNNDDWLGPADYSCESWAVLSAVMAALSCSPEKCLYEFTAELSVEYAFNAAAERGIDLGPIVTAELL